MKYKVLVIDDDEPIHIITKNLLGKEFSLVHARNAQEAIDILSETSINLILSDIHMPGISGLELLESVRLDKEKKQIPVLIMTNLPTVEKEQKAMDLGAADFIRKELFHSDKEKVLEAVRMKLVTNIQMPDLEEDLLKSKDRVVMKLMEKAISGTFEETVQTLCTELKESIDSDFIGFWMYRDDKTSLIYHSGEADINEEHFQSINDEKSFEYLKRTKEAYLSNHIYNEELGMLIDFSKEHSLTAEIGVPLYSVNERMLLMNDMKVPDEAPMFGVLVLKRAVLFSSNEFELVSRLITQAGSILYRLYKKSA